MSWLFIDSSETPQTLEQVSFFSLLAQSHDAYHARYRQRRDIIRIHTQIHEQEPAVIIMTDQIPLLTRTPKIVFGLPPSSRFSTWSVSTHWIHHTTLEKPNSYTLPVLLPTSPQHKKAHGSVFLSVAPFVDNSAHRLIVEAFAMLPKRIQKQYTLVCCGAPQEQSEIDLIRILGYNLPLQMETDLQQLHSWLQQSAIVFRMGKTHQDSLLDATILEYDVIVVHDGNACKSALYPRQHSLENGTAEALRQKIRSTLQVLATSFFHTEEQSKRLSLYHNLINSLSKR